MQTFFLDSFGFLSYHHKCNRLHLKEGANSLLSIETILERCKTSKIAVVGDICLDLYYFLNHENEEISVETGLQVNSVESFKQEVGGAGNVAVNCKTLGLSEVDVYGIVGDDVYGRMVKQILASHGVQTKHIKTQKDSWSTHVYHKIYHGHEELPRYDIGNFNQPDEGILKQLLFDLQKDLSSYDLIIINEQVQSGIHSTLFQAELNSLIEKSSDILWVTDSRRLQNIYKKTIHKLNNHEAASIASQLSLLPNTDNGIETAVSLYQYWETPVVMTRGENGVVVVDSDGAISIDGIHIIQPIDTVGAGDAFLAGFVSALSVSEPVQSAAAIGNFSAAVCIKKLFETGHPYPAEIVRMSKETDYRYRPYLAHDYRQANYYESSDIELINKDICGCFGGAYPVVSIFDHDGTISVLRQGWEEVMIKMMTKAVTGNAYSSLARTALGTVEKDVEKLIEKTTGIQTIIQMHELIHLIKKHSYVPAEEILTPEQYKSIYNTMLLEKVEEKQKLLRQGRLLPEDFMIKGVHEALIELHENGSRLYLASGTDVDDVKREASLLSYGPLFSGGIYGSVGNIDDDPKRKVIREIIGEINSRGIEASKCIVFGDGPVEMREAKKRGLVAIGVLSDEKQRFGKNLAKRERLVLAGADALLPDFSWMDELTTMLGIKK